ncbi:hypothetical protein Goshw_001840 [Gossypium schwendimanii]|uniref:Uncharacterized protein n=1 Tax=Gossypium schwendimanii TaxID=34291 RepID=A0A7J9LDE0_GOSSC|nr:hypothetical protein [Gossypium schwendimanii]
MESIRKSNAEKARENTLVDQFEAKRTKNEASRERKFARREERLAKGLRGKMPVVAPPAAAAQLAIGLKKSKKGLILGEEMKWDLIWGNGRGR